MIMRARDLTSEGVHVLSDPPVLVKKRLTSFSIVSVTSDAIKSIVHSKFFGVDHIVNFFYILLV